MKRHCAGCYETGYGLGEIRGCSSWDMSPSATALTTNRDASVRPHELVESITAQPAIRDTCRHVRRKFWDTRSMRIMLKAVVVACGIVAATSCASAKTTGSVESVAGTDVCLRVHDGSNPRECFPAVQEATQAGQIAGHEVGWYHAGMCVQVRLVSDGPWAVVDDEIPCPATASTIP